MELKELLEKQPGINKSEMARCMYPGVTSAAIIIQQKLRGAKVGNGHQRVTEEDDRKAVAYFKNLVLDIQEYIKSKEGK